VVALAGGVGAGKFLRGLTRAVPAEDVTAIVNTGDDLLVHGLHVSPDLDSVTYWLAGVADRERGWGRAGETFRTTAELRERFDADGAWFGLGDLDLATHLFRTSMLAQGATLSEATAAVCARFGVRSRVLPMTDRRVTTRIDVRTHDGGRALLDFQVYWVARGARDEVDGVVFDGAFDAAPAPGALEAIAQADAVLFCPSNPAVSIDPILAVPGIREAVAAVRDRAAGVSPIVGGRPLRGMADRLLPALGVEVSAVGVAARYHDLLRGWVIDEVDAPQRAGVEALGMDVRVVDSVMVDDAAAERVAHAALGLALGAPLP
jgi:LPPG:FO 2-phospho-L-lactate transferase